VRPAVIRIRLVSPVDNGFEIAQKTGLEPAATITYYCYCAEHQAAADTLFHELATRTAR
jgi:hypothetical protein